MSLPDLALVVAWVCIALLGLGLSGVLRQLHDLRSELSHRALLPPTGARLADPSLLDAVASRSRSLLLFVRAGCDACDEALASLNEIANRSAVIVVAEGELPNGLADAIPAFSSPSSFQALGVDLTPVGLLVNSDGDVEGAYPMGSRDRLKAVLGTLPDTTPART